MLIILKQNLSFFILYHAKVEFEKKNQNYGLYMIFNNLLEQDCGVWNNYIFQFFKYYWNFSYLNSEILEPSAYKEISGELILK